MCCPGPAGAVDLHQACAHRRRHGRDGASTRTGAAVSTRRNTGLSAGARGTAALLCVLMALTDIGWIIRDLNIAQHPADVWWIWLGEVRRPGEFTAWGTSALDPLLVLGALAAAAAALRAASSIASGALLALASATALLRLPLLWVLGAS